jgi:hypothetical protein
LTFGLLHRAARSCRPADERAIEIMDVGSQQVVALVLATSFAAGLNVYATVATLGLLARAGIVALAPSLEPLADWPVIGAAMTLYLVEFIADKIPAIDLVWNALQTFVRVPVAALIAYGASNRLSPAEQLVTITLGSAVALAAHGGKTAARVAVTPAPEPLSNIALSLGEDALAVFLTWLATRHPLWAAAIVAVLLAAIVALVRTVARAARTLFHGAWQRLRS